MQTGRQPSRLTLTLVLTWALLASPTGCSRQVAVPVSTGTTSSPQLPFDRASDSSGVSPTDAFPDGVPAGTEITVRLGAALSSADARVGDSFHAVLDEPVMVAGKAVVLQGAPVTGNVVDTKGRSRSDPGYLRITLASIAMNGRSIPLQTSSIFTKGGSYEKRTASTVTRSPAEVPGALPESTAGTEPAYAPIPSDVRFSTGRRFTFRLIQPLHL